MITAPLASPGSLSTLLLLTPGHVTSPKQAQQPHSTLKPLAHTWCLLMGAIRMVLQLPHCQPGPIRRVLGALGSVHSKVCYKIAQQAQAMGTSPLRQHLVPCCRSCRALRAAQAAAAASCWRLPQVGPAHLSSRVHQPTASGAHHWTQSPHSQLHPAMDPRRGGTGSSRRQSRLQLAAAAAWQTHSWKAVARARACYWVGGHITCGCSNSY